MRFSVVLPVLLAGVLSVEGMAQDAAPAVALTVKIVGAETSMPVPGVRVRLRGGAGAVTDANGSVTFAELRPGRHTVEVNHPEGGTLTHAVAVPAEGASVELGIRPRAGAVTLAPLVAMGDRTEAEMRTRGTRDALFTRDEIAAVERQKQHVGDLLRGTPGVRVTDYFHPRLGRRLCIESGRGGVSLGTRRVCRMVRVILDGVQIPEADAMLLNLSLNSIESVEWLNAVEAGVRYGTGSHDGAEAVLVIHTRGTGPHARRGAPSP